MINKKYKYIFGKIASPAKSAENDYKIRRINDDFPVIKDNANVHEYDSLEQLAAYDKLFALLSKEKQREIFKEENIENIIGYFLVDINKIDKKNTANFLQHTVFGDVFGGKVGGVHHMTGLINGVVEIERVIKQSDKNGVYEVEVKRKDGRFLKNKSVKEWRLKKTTFFPDSWNMNILYQECFFAFSRKIFKKECGENLLWTSKTNSGIPVEIYTNKDERLLSIYPLYTEHNL